MRFWDSSALAAVILRDALAVDFDAILVADPGACIWWGTAVECASALARRSREGRLSARDHTDARQSADILIGECHEVEPTPELRAQAVTLLRETDLRTADALQLAAALAWAGSRPSGAEFVCLDRRLRDAATAAGFQVLPLDDGSIPG